MKKLLLATIISLTFSLSLSAFAWSGLIDNTTRATENHDFSVMGLNQGNGIYFSLSHNLSENGSLRLAAEGLYKYSLYCDMKTNKFVFKNIADLDLLKFTGDWTLGKGTLSLNAGRFQYQDYSSAVFSQLSDGLYLSYNALKFKTSLYAGYTGLLNRLDVSMVENESKEEDQFYALCPGYIPVAADFAYKALFGTNTAGLQAACYIPVSEKNKIKGYGTLIMNGYFGTIGSYDARVTVGTEKFENLMLDAKLDTNFYLLSSLLLTLGGEYVSGEQGSIKPFVTLTARSFGCAPVYNGVIVPKAGLLFAAGNFYGSVTERVILTMPKEEVKLAGFDTALSLAWNVFSDVRLACDAGAYICTEKKELSNYYASLKASLAF